MADTVVVAVIGKSVRSRADRTRFTVPGRVVRFGFVLTAAVALALLTAGCTRAADRSAGAPGGSAVAAPVEVVRESVPDGAAVATFAGGCFWCTEAVFQQTPGVSNAISGYAGGTEPDPSYEDVYTGRTSHREALQVYFDPADVSYKELLDVFWRSIDPTDAGGQFVDRGPSYSTAIYVRDEQQRRAAERSKRELAESGRFSDPIATQIVPFTTFYQAEDYHQDFYQKSSERYAAYEGASGREEFKARVWQEIQRGQE